MKIFKCDPNSERMVQHFPEDPDSELFQTGDATEAEQKAAVDLNKSPFYEALRVLSKFRKRGETK